MVHSAHVIEMTEDAIGDLREAESGQRGFILTHDPAYARSFADRTVSSTWKIRRVAQLTSDNPLQHARALEIETLMIKRATVMGKPLDLGRAGDFAGAAHMIGGGRGRELMAAIDMRAQIFLDEEASGDRSTRCCGP